MNLQTPMKPFIKQRYWCSIKTIMNLKKVLIKVAAMIVVVFTVVSCDDDFNSVGSEVIGGVNFRDNKYNAVPIAYSKRFQRVQTSGLPNNLIGFYDDPIYGQSTYSVLSQVLPDRFNPTFGDNPVLDSVVLTLPYFSDLQQTTTSDDGAVVNTYELDSVYGSGTINLSVYRSGYFLKDFDANSGSEERQVYYSNDITENFGNTILQEKLLFQINNHEPSPLEIPLLTEDTDSDEDTDPQVTTIPPALRRVVLSDDAAEKANQLNPNPNNVRVGDQELINYFKTVFIDVQGGLELSNANIFHNYFRGIYFKAELSERDGSLIFFDITDANITLHYSFGNNDVVDDDTTDTVGRTGELALNFSNNIVNSIETTFNTAIEDELSNQDEVNGEENLYLKGGEGAYAVIDLFTEYVEVDSNGDFVLDENENPIIIKDPTEEEKVKTELDFLKSRGWLINEASMKLYIDQDRVVAGETEPERIYIFNLETGNVLIDYQLDPTANGTSPINSVTDHLGVITRDSDDRGEFYKIKLTRYIINLLSDDTDNAKLGLSVSQNINIVSTAEGFTTPTNTEDEIIPFSSIISHEGTILYGNGANVPEEKRLKLDIFYTESTTN